MAAKTSTTKKATTGYDEKVVLRRIKALRKSGHSWRALSAALNAEGVTTPKGCQWGSNGSQAFALAKKHGIG